MTKYLLALLLGLAPSLAFGQASPTGPFTAGHALRATGPSGTPYSDAGGAAGSAKPGSGYLSEIGITNTGTPFCINDALTSAQGGYHQLCLGANSLGGALLSYNAYGSASTLGFNVNLNGTTYTFPFISGGIQGPNTTTTNDVAIWNNTAGTLLRGSAAPWTATGALSGTSSVVFDDYAKFTITDTATNTTAGTPKLDGLGVFHSFSGGEGARNAIFAQLEQTGATPFTNGAYHFFTSVFGYTKVTVGDAAPNGDYYAFGGLTEVFGTAGATGQVKGAEFDTSVHSGASVTYNAGLTVDLVNGHASQGSVFDAGIAIGVDATVTKLWKNGISFGDTNGPWPIDSTGTLITTTGAGGSTDAAYGIDFSAAGFTVCSIKVPGLCIDGRGNVDLSTVFPHLQMQDLQIANPNTNGGMIRIAATGASPDAYVWQVNTAVAGDFSTALSAFEWDANGTTKALGAFIVSGTLTVPGSTTPAITSAATFTSGAGAQTGTLTNAPTAGDPTSWIKINDNGTTRYIPAW